MRTFYNYLIDNKDYLIKNIWKKVKLKSERSTDISISREDFFDLLLVISPSESIVQVGKTVRNMYRPWLKDAIKLKAYTGRRNAEIFAMRWNMIHYEDGMPIYIKSPNIKVNTLQNNFDERDFQYAYVPIGEELFDLLTSLGLSNNRNSGDYILLPDVAERKAPNDLTSKAFSFFFKKLNRNYARQLNHLRKTYITSEDLFINSRFSMQHSNYRTTSKHYVDKGEVAKQMVKNGFRVFPEQKNDFINYQVENSTSFNIGRRDHLRIVVPWSLKLPV